jgi:hypothetical protein
MTITSRDGISKETLSASVTAAGQMVDRTSKPDRWRLAITALLTGLIWHGET